MYLRYSLPENVDTLFPWPLHCRVFMQLGEQYQLRSPLRFAKLVPVLIDSIRPDSQLLWAFCSHIIPVSCGCLKWPFWFGNIAHSYCKRISGPKCMMLLTSQTSPVYCSPVKFKWMLPWGLIFFICMWCHIMPNHLENNESALVDHWLQWYKTPGVHADVSYVIIDWVWHTLSHSDVYWKCLGNTCWCQEPQQEPDKLEWEERTRVRERNGRIWGCCPSGAEVLES